MVKIVHSDYDKISDVCMWLCSEYVLKFTVELNKRTDKWGKQNFHKEYGYQFQNELRVNIMRDFQSYLSIESTKRSIEGNKVQVRIGINDIYFFNFKLKEVVSWFTNETNRSLFAKKDGRIIIPTKVNPIIVNVSFGSYVEFEPSVMTYNNQEQVIGVRVYLNSDGVSFFMDVNTLLSFSYFISTFNMYQSAQLMLNYIGRPEFGYNYSGYDIERKNNIYNKPGFFDKVKATRREE